jgi:2-haloacid dehalogenase
MSREGIDFTRFDALTFDCYGTLIDWEAGITEALGDLLGPAADAGDPVSNLEAFARFESEAESGVFRSYRDVLREVARRFGADFDIRVDEDAADAFASSVGSWQPFPDTVDALKTLSERYRLGIVSNVDDELFAQTATQLGVDFEEVVTAQQIQSYKPARAHFDEVLRRLDLPRERVLHVAQSLHHDIAPARSMGFTCVWVNRAEGRPGAGATPPAEASPDLVVPDLATLAGLALP